jgi:hypothetical protein
MAFQILSKIEGHLLETMQTGKLAVIQLEKENTITKLKRAASKFTS